jgi:hypothetical membrane protein
MATTEPDPTANPDTADRVAAAFGVLAVVVSLGGIASAIALSTRFSFATDALSDLGRATWRSSTAFNTGLLVSGLCALVPGVVLVRNSRTLLHAAGSLAFSFSAVCLALIGVFALPAPQHGTVAVGFFLGFTVAFLLYGAADLRSGARRWGLFAIALAAVHVGSWAVWIAAGTPGGLALPEIVGSGCVSAWILGTAVRLW